MKSLSRAAGLALCLLWICEGVGWAGKPIGADAFGALRALEAPTLRPPEIGETYEPRTGEVIALLGGTNVVEEQRTGYFEALLHAAWPEKQLVVRSLAWEADTIDRQQRPQYFYETEHRDKQPGSTADLRQRVKPDTVMIRFGKMESLEGMEALPKFRTTFEGYLDRLTEITPRIIVVTPTPFFESGPAAALAKERNRVLVAYCLAMVEICEERGLMFADLYQFEPDRPYSENGVHLNDAGQRAVAERLVQQLTEQPSPDVDERLREAVAWKNQVWYQYFRPTNWAFLYGDRQHVPSSRDHVDSEKRWFPYEIERALPLIAELETQIHELVD